MNEALSYPLGRFKPLPFEESLKKKWIADIRYLPLELENSILNLNEEHLKLPYRPGGWSISQLVHHVADSHMNCFIRFKLALTENWPSIKPYDQDAWVLQADVATIPVNTSLTLLHALHERLTALLVQVTEEDWEKRGIYHPGYEMKMSLWYLLGLYSWHGKHHTAHIVSARERMKI